MTSTPVLVVILQKARVDLEALEAQAGQQIVDIDLRTVKKLVVTFEKKVSGDAGISCLVNGIRQH